MSNMISLTKKDARLCVSGLIALDKELKSKIYSKNAKKMYEEWFKEIDKLKWRLHNFSIEEKQT